MTHERPSPGEPPGRIFIGRKPELAELTRGLDHALAGRGRLVLLVGEPGIGKTRLAGELAVHAASRGVQVLWGRCWEGEGAPAYWPWVQIIRGAVEARDPERLRAEMGPGAADIAKAFPEVRERLPDVVDPPPLDGEQARFRLFDSIATFVKHAARAEPLTFIFEDLHWADKDSLLLLRFLAREMAEFRLFILCTYRDVEVQRGHPLAEILPALRREPVHERVLLRGLAEADVRALLVAQGGADVPEALAQAIFRESEGNPFFIGEILRHLVEEGVIGTERGRWTSRVAPEQIRVPESVRDVIGRRLDHLSKECNQVLTIASVIGREFGMDALERASDIPADRLSALLDEAVDAQVLNEVPRALGRYSFAHTLIRETLYAELRTLERVRRHHRVAEVLEGIYARNPGPHIAELAHHFLEALPGGDVAKAVDYATRAGDRAHAQLAYEDAAIHYERALQALELQEQPDERQRGELLLRLGAAQWSAGGREKPEESTREATRIAERLGDSEFFARAALAATGPVIGMTLFVGDESGRALLERALAALDGRDSALRARVMGKLASLLTLTAHPRAAASLARAAIEMARRVGDRGALAYVLDATPYAISGPDNLDERLALAEELTRLAGEIGDVRLAAEAHGWKASHHLELGDIAAVDREAEIQEHIAETSHQVYLRALAAAGRYTRAVLEGRFEEGEEHIKAAGEYRTVDSPHVGLVHMLREQQGRVEEILPGVASFAVRYPQNFLWRMAVAGYRAKLKQGAEARREVECLAADLTDVPRDFFWLNTMSWLAEVVSFVGDVRRAATLYDLLLPYVDRCVVSGALYCRGAVARPLGILATLLSRYDDAERHFEKALEMNARIRARIWVAHTQHDYARMLVARDGPGDRERAAALAAQALATAREVGMKPLEEDVLELQSTARLAEAENVAPTREGPSRLAASAVFRREGDFWTIAYEGTRLRLKDAKGLQYIAHLLRHEGQEFHAADLAAGGETEPERGSDAGAIVAGLGDAGERLDAPARAAYRQRLQDLEAELAEATEWADAGRAEKLRAEVEFLREELSTAYGLGGRARKAADTSDRARKAVTSRIRESIERIGKEHPALARHLENAIRTGTFCSYQPDRPVGWEL
jgi:hypothetical protein